MMPVFFIVVGFLAVLVVVYWFVRRGSDTSAKPGDGGWSGTDGGHQRGQHDDDASHDVSSSGSGDGDGGGSGGDGGGD